MHYIIHGETRYRGLYVQHENGHYWIMDERGSEQYVGTTAPTAAMIEAYRANQ